MQEDGGGHESKSASRTLKLYSREFLVSLRDLEVCKKLPPDFDASLLSEFEEAPCTNVEWQRVSGGQSLQGPKREYGHARWDTRSSSSNDGDGQSDRDSDTGKRFGNYRWTRKGSEHDGLLGSGAFPRPPGYGIGGPSAPSGRGSGPFLLNKTSEPYQPPRPYKAMPPARRDNTDSFNDETFGSAECSNDDRDEEERKRRASFELLRKEQQKSLQGKLKHNSEKHTDHVGIEVDSQLSNSEKEQKFWINNANSVNDSYSAPLDHDEYVKSLPSGASASRPLVPPGFAGSVNEKNVESSLQALEMDSVFVADTSVSAEAPILSSDSPRTKKFEIREAIIDDTVERQTSRNVTIEQSFGYESPAHLLPAADSCSASAFSSCQTSLASVEWDTGNIGRVATEVGKLNGVEASGRDTSILQKLFKGSLTLNDNAPAISEEAMIANDDPWDPVSSETSKFVHWFAEEDKKIFSDTSKPRDLLSLLGSGGNSGRGTSGPPLDFCSDMKPSELPSQTGVIADKPDLLPTISGNVNRLKPVFHSTDLDSKHGVLTCEDLEQFILSEANEGNSDPRGYIQDASSDMMNAKSVLSKAAVDDHASLHLLKLLQKGSSKDTKSEVIDRFESFDNSSMKMGSAEEVPKPDKTLTLEALFGSAFMKELHSVGAPVSAKGSSVGGNARSDLSGSNHGFPLSSVDSTSRDSDFHVTGEKCDFGRSEHGHIRPIWSGFNDSQSDTMKFNGCAFAPEDRANRMVDFQLPEEDSLICSNEVLNLEPSNLTQMRDTRKVDGRLTLNEPVEVVGRVGGLNSFFKGDQSILPRGFERLPPFQHNASLDSEHILQKLHGQRVPPHFSNHYIDQNQFGAFVPQAMEQNVNAEILRPGNENISHHALHHPFQPSMYPHHHPYHGLEMLLGFDTPQAHPPLQEISPVPGNFSSSHSVHGLPKSAFIPSAMNHFGGHGPQDVGPIQGFPSSQRPSDFAVPMSGTMAGNGAYPDALERYQFDLRMKEMESRGNAKQVYQVGGGHVKAPGPFVSPELELGFR